MNSGYKINLLIWLALALGAFASALNSFLVMNSGIRKISFLNSTHLGEVDGVNIGAIVSGFFRDSINALAFNLITALLLLFVSVARIVLLYRKRPGEKHDSLATDKAPPAPRSPN